MKYISFILCIYVFSLFTVPCGDNDNCAQSEVNHASTEDNGKDSQHEEPCSPFCACACCGCRGFNIEPSYKVEVAVNKKSENKVTPYQPQFISQFTASIWQPPKLG